MSQKVMERILAGKIVAIIRGIPCDMIMAQVEALYQGGIYCMEVTFDQTSEEGRADTLKSIRKIREYFGEKVCVGAGTVMTEQQVRLAAEAGAEYMISPDANEAVIKTTKSIGKISIPGALSATEAAKAYEWGADLVKLFPAGVLGAGYLKAVRAPLKHIPFMAVGGVNLQNCREFMEAGAVGVGVGGSLNDRKLLETGRCEEIVAAAKRYVEALQS